MASLIYDSFILRTKQLLIDKIINWGSIRDTFTWSDTISLRFNIFLLNLMVVYFFGICSDDLGDKSCNVWFWLISYCVHQGLTRNTDLFSFFIMHLRNILAICTNSLYLLFLTYLVSQYLYVWDIPCISLNWNL